MENIQKFLTNMLNVNKKNFIDIYNSNNSKIFEKLWYKSTYTYAKQIKKSTSNEISEISMIIDAMRYRKYHSQLVLNIALKIFDDNINLFQDQTVDLIYIRKILYLSCLMHDIQKFSEPHNDKSAEWFKKNIKKYMIIDDIAINHIYTIIQNHNGELRQNQDMTDSIKLLILIVRISDKLSKLQENSNYIKISDQTIKNRIQKVLKNSKKYLPQNYINSEIFLQKIQINFSFENGIIV